MVSKTTQDFIDKYGYNPLTHGWANAPHRTAASYAQERRENARLRHMGFDTRPQKRTYVGSNRARTPRYGGTTTRATRKYPRRVSFKRTYQRRYYRPRTRVVYRSKNNWFRDYLNNRTKAYHIERAAAAASLPTTQDAIDSMDDSMIDESSSRKRART